MLFWCLQGLFYSSQHKSQIKLRANHIHSDFLKNNLTLKVLDWFRDGPNIYSQTLP